jgi:hypothetical protein
LDRRPPLWVNRYTWDLDGMSASTSTGRAPKGEIDVKGQKLPIALQK